MITLERPFGRRIAIFKDRSLDKSKKQQLPAAARLYIAVIGVAGAAGAVICFHGWTPHLQARFLVYLLIALASSGMKVTLPGVSGSISVNYVFTLLALLQFEVPETLLLALVAAAAQTLWHAKHRPRPEHLLFNLSCITLMVLAAASVYRQPWFLHNSEGQILRLTMAGMVYFIVNTLLVSIIIALTESRNIRSIWQEFYNWSFSFYLVGVSLAEIVHLSMERLGWTFTLAMLPLLYMIFRSYKLYMGRMEQEKNHAENMAALHLRTIEALAMAIEAKDECTSEHLRRVQIYSMKIAEHLGLSPNEIQALQAASILHDIGKLAVPDYIISKPGKLTPEEFERMKVHTVVGAAILEQVAFPYAVSPIVRSHHERWDGSGYPDGLRGEEIPIGARILSAVDCLDALATDRQYRRALPIDEAMAYVASLSEKSFDPRVIDILKHHYRDFEKEAQSAPMRESLFDKNMVVSRGEAPDAGYQADDPSSHGGAGNESRAFLEAIAMARHEVQTLLESIQGMGGSLRLEEMLSMVSERLKRLVPFDCIAVYIREGDVLKPKYVNGEGSKTFASLEIPVGDGLSGWVVENRKPIINGNPSVEPGYLNDPKKFSLLSSALSVPLAGEQMTGALTLYRAELDGYNRDQLKILLAVRGKIARAIERAIRYQQAQQQGNVDTLTGLPNALAFYLHLQDEIVRCTEQQKSFALLACDLDGFQSINDNFGHLTGNEMLKRVALVLQENCRGTDYVARMGGDEFVVLLVGAVPDELEDRMRQLDRMVRVASREICGEEKGGVSIGTACFPDDGNEAETLLGHADNDMYRAKRARKAGVVVQLPRPAQVA